MKPILSTRLAVLLVILISFSSLAISNANKTKAQTYEIITINSDGSINPINAPIIKTGNTYKLERNLYGEIIIERSYTIFDGAGYSINSSSSLAALTLRPEIPLFGNYILNVTIRNINIIQAEKGILMQSTNNSLIINNTITNSNTGIILDIYGTGNTIAGNNLTSINGNAIWVWTSNNSIISNYIIGNSGSAIRFTDWAGNIVAGNHIENNQIGISSWAGNPITPGLVNLIYYNNFINNTIHFLNEAIFKFNSTELLYPLLVHLWDNETVGNYWSDYNGTDLDGNSIGDSSYFVDDNYLGENNTDNYPLFSPIEVIVPSLVIPTPSPSPSPSPSPTPTPSITPSPTPTPTIKPTSTPSPTATPTPTPSLEPESTPNPEPEFPTTTLIVSIAIVLVGFGVFAYLVKKRTNK